MTRETPDRRCHTRDNVLRLAAALQETSEHPLAHAVMDKVRNERLAVPEARDAKALPGRDVEATIRRQVLARRSSRLLRELGAHPGPLAVQEGRRENAGRTVSWLVHKEGANVDLPGLPAFGDTIRGRALAVAKELGIDEVLAECCRPTKPPSSRRCVRRAEWWRWSATASTTRQRWRRQAAGSSCRPELTWQWRRPASP